MGVKATLHKLQRAMRGSMDSFELRDGRRYYFDPQETFKATFRFFTDSMSADYLREPRPEPPDLLKAVAGAKDREEALARVMGNFSHLPIDQEALVERGEFVPRSLVSGRTYDEWMRETP